MTAIAFVRARGGTLAPQPELEAAVRIRSSENLVRLVLRDRGAEATVEPFVGSASVAAWLGITRKFEAAVAVLRALAVEARRYADEVFIVRGREGFAEPPPHDVTCDELSKALEAESTHVRVVGVLRSYRANRVEVELYAPALVGTQSAAGYFATFDVLAETERAARAALHAALETEGRIRGIESLEVTDVLETGLPGASRVGGRAYFGG